MTVDCPFECEFLQEARRHEKSLPLDETQIPDRDISLSERFLQEHEGLVAFLGRAIREAASATPGAIDFDVREALQGLVRTYRTLASGMYYESIPANPLAANVFRQMQTAVAGYREAENRELGVSRTRDADVLGTLVFYERLELDRNNGRRRGRAFLDLLREFYSEETLASEPPSSPLILP